MNLISELINEWYDMSISKYQPQSIKHTTQNINTKRIQDSID